MKKELASKADALEQYQRLNSVRIYGIHETGDDNEDTTLVVTRMLDSKLKLNIKPTDIDISHRLGVASEGKPRPIIVRFLRREDRLKALRSRKNLKGSGISIHPDLTRPRAALFKQESTKLKEKNIKVWVDFSGRIFREPMGTEKRNTNLKRVELFPRKFPGIYGTDEVDFSNM